MVIGITGQTGAGKSTVCSYAKKLGFAALNADLAAKEALVPGSDCLKALAEFFGYDIIDDNGFCKRTVLARRAFSDAASTEMLNRITHPWIISRCREYINELSHKNNTAILFDAPQLYESGGDVLCDMVIAVTAPAEVRLERIIRRDGLSEEEALLRMRAQKSEEYYTCRADAVIDGGQPEEKVRESFRRIVEKWGILKGH